MKATIETCGKQYSVEEIENKFSVEKVTKDFFEKYKENFIPTGFKSGAKEDYLFKLAKVY